jgi:hypothetical protein
LREYLHQILPWLVQVTSFFQTVQFFTGQSSKALYTLFFFNSLQKYIYILPYMYNIPLSVIILSVRPCVNTNTSTKWKSTHSPCISFCKFFWALRWSNSDTLRSGCWWLILLSCKFRDQKFSIREKHPY